MAAEHRSSANRLLSQRRISRPRRLLPRDGFDDDFRSCHGYRAKADATDLPSCCSSSRRAYKLARLRIPIAQADASTRALPAE